MPVQSNDFDRFTDPNAARAALHAMGIRGVEAAKAQYDADGIKVITGNLRRSHTYAIQGDHVDVGVTADYGSHVHFGTSKRTARPWLRNAYEAHRAEIEKAGVDAWKRRLGE